MPQNIKFLIPFTLGIGLGVTLSLSLHWWGFLVLFPWIGFSLSIGILLRQILHGRKRLLGRKISILLILPSLLFFVPIVNNENFQLEGVAMIVMIGFFSKGFVHYCIAKILGPLVWRRGFCGYACWTAAVLDWLPISSTKQQLPRKYRNIRFISLAISLALPIVLLFAFSYNPWTDYINKREMIWMFAGNALYYAVAIPLAFALSDKRAFCKYLCPVSLVMKPSASLGVLKIKPDVDKICISCSACNRQCPMGVDVMSCMRSNTPVLDTECILCNDCRIVCPTGKVK